MTVKCQLRVADFKYDINHIFAGDMKERLFRFKQFAVRHEISAMKVGVDGVLTGAWGSVGKAEECPRILDVGTGCGLIALMCLQRNPGATVTAVELDRASAEEARCNFRSSPWHNRVELIEGDINRLAAHQEWKGRFNYILSNPPFFSSGVVNPDTPREKARHAGTLSPERVIALAAILLGEGGEVSLIAPAESEERLMAEIEKCGLIPLRICRVADSISKAPKRVMICAGMPPLKPDVREISESLLFIKNTDGSFSDEYISLSKEFYLNF